MDVEMCSSAGSFPSSIDPAFNFGSYEETPFPCWSILVESKSKDVTEVWVPATMIGSVVIQHGKSRETYKTDMKSIAKNCKLEEREELFIVTDGEVVFNQCTMLHCTRHFEGNCSEFLKKLRISSSLKEVSMIYW